MVTVPNITEEEKAPILVCSSMSECVNNFPGSVVTFTAKMDTEVDRRIASASGAFGALCQAVFRERTLTSPQSVYQACVLSVLLMAQSVVFPCTDTSRGSMLSVIGASALSSALTANSNGSSTSSHR